MKFTGVLAAAGSLASVFGTEHLAKNVRKNFGHEQHRLVEINVNDVSDVVHQIFNEHGYDKFGHSQGNLHVKLPNDAIKALEMEGIQMKDFTEEFLSEMERSLMQDKVCSLGAEECGTQSAELFYSQYQTWESIYARFEMLAANNPGTEWTDLGQTYENRTQKLYWIGDQTKPLVWYFCAIHAREWLTPMYCTWMAEELVNPDNEMTQGWLEDFSFVITPVANVDGYHETHVGDNFWRKTRKPNLGSDCIGTDPNRNYAFGWGGEGASADPCTQTYHGRKPFDQNATANIKAFADSMNDRMIHINDVHSYGDYWMSPYAGSLELPPAEDWWKMDDCNNAVFDAILEHSGRAFNVGPVASTIYEAAGGAVDYFYGVNGLVHSYTYEVRGGTPGAPDYGFQPNPSNIVPSNIEIMVGTDAALKCIARVEQLETTPYPTTSPTPCGDMDPNFIFFADGTPAPCEILANYCPVYEVVAERCPGTCDTCDVDISARKRMMGVDAVFLKPIAAGSAISESSAVIVGAVAGVAVVAVAAAYVVKRREQ